MIPEHAFDIETIPNEDIIPNLPPPEVAYRNAKDPEKRKAKEEEAKQKQLEKLGLSPLTGRVCCGAFYGSEIKKYRVISEPTDTEEINLLNWIFELLWHLTENNEYNNGIIITHNGMAFDFRFIYVRAMILKMEFPKMFPILPHWTKRYTRVPHCDLLMEFCNWSSNTTGWNLDAIGRAVLGRGKTDRDYSTYLDLIKNGKGEKIGLDCLCDTGITFDIYQQMKNYIF
jgi:DNA polymerase elongation subunit (family B)